MLAPLLELLKKRLVPARERRTSRGIAALLGVVVVLLGVQIFWGPWAPVPTGPAPAPPDVAALQNQPPSEEPLDDEKPDGNEQIDQGFTLSGVTLSGVEVGAL